MLGLNPVSSKKTDDRICWNVRREKTARVDEVDVTRSLTISYSDLSQIWAETVTNRKINFLVFNNDS